MIIEKATELGMALSNSDEFRRLQAAKAAMDADKHVNELMEQYTQKQDKMVSMLENADSEGIEVSAIAKEIDDIQTELVENPVFEEMMEAQHCFANLMNEVNRTIGAYIGMNTEDLSRLFRSCFFRNFIIDRVKNNFCSIRSCCGRTSCSNFLIFFYNT